MMMMTKRIGGRSCRQRWCRWTTDRWGRGRRSRPDGIGGRCQRVTRMTVARSTPAYSDKSYQNPFIRPVGDEPIGLHVIVFTALTSPSSSSSSCVPQPGGQRRSPPPRRTCVSAITKWARQVAWLESSNGRQAWGTGLCGRASGKPWLLRKVTQCTAQCATTSSNSRPSYLGWKNGGSATWWTATSSERPTTAPGIFSVA